MRWDGKLRLLAQQGVQFVRGVEFRLKLFARQACPKVIDSLPEAVERARDIFGIGQ